MKTSHLTSRFATGIGSVLLLPLLAVPAHAQALPAAEASPISTGFSLPHVAGTLQYAVSASESLSSGYYGTAGVASATSLSGDLAYLSNSKLYPFSMVFSGGHSWATSGEPAFSFEDLAVSQVVNVGRWNLLLSDSVNYLPGTPTTGLSGVPGVGDLGVTPVPTTANAGQGVLTGFSSQLTDTASLSLQRQITGDTALQASGSYSILRFVGNSGSANNPGLNSDSTTASLALTHRIDARNSLGANYAYSRYTYSGANYGIAQPGFASQTASLQYTRQLTRKVALVAAAGPQWTSIDSPGESPFLSLFANLSTTFTGKFSQLSLAYTRSTNSGYGVVGGAIANSVTFTSSRTFNRVWMAALTSAYTQTQNLPAAGVPAFTFDTTVAGAQLSRAIARNLSAYVSYTLEDQSNQGATAAVDLFSGLSQIAGFGLTYSPSSFHLGHP